MRNDPTLMIPMLRDVNALYLQQGEAALKSLRERREQLSQTAGQVFRKQDITPMLHQHLERPQYHIGIRLMATYKEQLKKTPDHIHPLLRDWYQLARNKMKRGKTMQEAFGLFRKEGRPKGSSSLPVIQIVSKYAFLKHEGHSSTEAKNLIKEEIGITERTLNRYIEKMLIDEYIETPVLKEFAANDYSVLYGSGH